MSDYLWDKSGEPDEEVARLEELLGELRYRPQPFELPREEPRAQARAARRRLLFFRPAYAAAAALVLMLLAGLWLGAARFRNQKSEPVAAVHQQAPPPRHEATAKPAPDAATPATPVTGPEKPESVGQLAAVPDRPGRRVAERAATRRAADRARAQNVEAGFVRRAPGDAAPGWPRRDQAAETLARLGDERRRLKDELMFALRLTSAKLNVAQRETQGGTGRKPARENEREDY